MELVGVGQVLAEQGHERVDVAVEDRQPLRREVDGVRPTSGLGVVRLVGSLGHLAAVGGESVVAERGAVADGVDVEEVLVLEREAHHPLRQGDRVGDAGVAHLGVDLEELVGERADLAVRVVGGEQHLDEVADPALDQRHELLGLLPFGFLAQRVHDRRGVGGPARRRPVVEEPARAQAGVDGLAEHLQPVAVVRSGEPHGPGDVIVLECRPYQQVGDVVGVEPGDHRRKLLVVGRARHQVRTSLLVCRR